MQYIFLMAYVHCEQALTNVRRGKFGHCKVRPGLGLSFGSEWLALNTEWRLLFELPVN
jgi:hypothetical protein